MLSKFKNLTIIQWLFFYVFCSFVIFICLFDGDVSIYNKLKLINQKNGFQYISEHYDEYKVKYNINDFKCTKDNDFLRSSPFVDKNINELLSITFNFTNEKEINKWILENPKSYEFMQQTLNNIQIFDKINKLCTKDENNEEEFVLFQIIKLLNKETNDKVDKFNNYKILNCKTTNNQNVRISKYLSYNIEKTNKNVFYFYKNDSFYNLNFCE